MILSWTTDYVEMRLRKAVALKTRLSDIGADFASVAEGVGIKGGTGAGDEVVVEAVEALSWLRRLEPDNANIVLTRLEGAPWKSICFRFGISRPTADRRYRYALALIAWRLNGRGISEPAPSLRSLLGMRSAA